MNPVWLTVMMAGLVGAVAWAWAWWRRARAVAARVVRRRRVARPELPIVLAHGMFGFDAVEFRGRKYEYFRGVRTRLLKAGAEVHVVRLAPVGSVKARAAQLVAHVNALDAPRVNLVAHSMGGIDARYALARLGLDAKVASLTTIGAPHRGTPLADVGGAVLGPRVARALRMDGVGDITTKKMAAFNRRIRDVDGVAYFSHVGALAGIVPSNLHPLLVPGFLWLRDRAGVNDGVVPSDSQAWGEVLGDVDADHWAQVGWSKRFDAPEFYAGLLRELRGRGF